MHLPDQILETGVALKDQYFDLSRLSTYSSIGISTLRAHIKRDALPCFRLRGKILVRRSEFDAWINQFRLHKKQDISRIVDEAINKVKLAESDG